MARTTPNSQAKGWGGYVLIPHELLHVIGYRLVGQPCRYRWGEPYVTPPHPISRGRNLIGALLPFAVFFILTLTFGLLSGFAAKALIQEGYAFWFVFWLALTFVAGFYLTTTLGDLRQAYLLLTGKPWYGWTPFDFFFYPFVDWQDIRRRVSTGELDVKQD